MNMLEAYLPLATGSPKHVPKDTTEHLSPPHNVKKVGTALLDSMKIVSEKENDYGPHLIEEKEINDS